MRHTLLVLALTTVACGDGGPTDAPEPTGSASLRVVHTLAGVAAVDVLVAGQVVVRDLSFGDVSAVSAVPAGAQPVAFRASGGSVGPETVLSFVAGDTTTVLTVGPSDIINPWVLSDSGSAVPADRTKLRAVHSAEHAPNLLAWRTQPDHGTFITIQFPLPYQTTTPYVESDPGDWRVLVSTETYNNDLPVATDTLALSNAIAIPAGESRTVILLDDGSGGVELVVLGS